MIPWDIIDKFKNDVKNGKGIHGEAKNLVTDANMGGWELLNEIEKNGLDGIDENKLFIYCKSHWLGYNLWCSHCHLFGTGLCKKYAEKHGAETISDYLIKNEIERNKKNGVQES